MCVCVCVCVCALKIKKIAKPIWNFRLIMFDDKIGKGFLDEKKPLLMSVMVKSQYIRARLVKCWLVGFNGISTSIGYLMLKPVYTYYMYGL